MCDGGDGYNKALKSIRYMDSVSAVFGDGGDLQIYHDSTNSYINNYTGKLFINNQTNDSDIVFRCDDGSGGVTDYITLDGSQGFTTAQKHIRFEDNVNAQFGTGGDMGIYHNGSNGFIKNDIGDLTIQNTADDKDIILQSDNGSGGVMDYVLLDGSDVSTAIKTIKVLMPNLPTSDPSVAGQLYIDASADRVLKVSAG